MREQMFERDQHLKADPYTAQPELHVAAAYRIAAMYVGSSPENSEQLSDAMYGLMVAAKKYDPTLLVNGKRVRFISFAYRGMQIQVLQGHRERKAFIPRGRSSEHEVFSIDPVTEKTLGDAKTEVSQHAEEVQILKKVLETLPEQMRLVISLRMQGLTHDEVGQRIGRSKQRSQQIEKKAHRQLRDAMAEAGVQDI